MMMHPARQEDADARTWVIWDIKSCPFPSGCDARRVGPCIKRALENLGYSGPLTITAIGHLLDVPEDVLQSISYTGISLYHIPFDVVNILEAMLEWGHKYQPPVNILLISARDFSDGLEYLQRKGFNILSQILYDDSVWKSFLTDTTDSEENSSEKVKVIGYAQYVRLMIAMVLLVKALKISGSISGVKNIVIRLRRYDDDMAVDASRYYTSTILNKRKAPTQEEAEARTWVIWDIKSCPVPSGCDAHRVGPCIKRALQKLGYSGPLTITAIGHLIDFPEEVLESVSSSGISLYHIPYDRIDILDAMCKLGSDKRRRPANLLLISARDFSYALEKLQKIGLNILPQILFDDSHQEAFPTSTKVESLWKSFLTDTMDSEEKSRETSECVWLCKVCNDFAGEGFEKLAKHLRSGEHRERMLACLPPYYKLKRDEDKEEVEATRRKLRDLSNSIPRNKRKILK